MVDGVPLKQRLAKAERNRRLTALAMVAPLLLFIIFSFVVPIGDAVPQCRQSEFSLLMPETTAGLAQWNPKESDLPPEEVFASLHKELLALREAGDIGKIASRLNYEMSGARSLITKSGRKFKRIKKGPYTKAIIKADKRWGKKKTWATIKVASEPTTASFYLASIDKKYDENLDVVDKAVGRYT